MSAANLAVLVATFFALVAGHWFPWHLFPALVDSDKRLKAVPAHTYGVVCILIGYSALATINGWLVDTVYGLTACAIAAGLGTIVPRILFAILDRTADDGK